MIFETSGVKGAKAQCFRLTLNIIFMSVLCYSKNDIAFSIIIRFVIHKTNLTLQELGEEGRCYWRQILPRKSRIFFWYRRNLLKHTIWSTGIHILQLWNLACQVAISSTIWEILEGYMMQILVGPISFQTTFTTTTTCGGGIQAYTRYQSTYLRPIKTLLEVVWHKWTKG